MTSIPAIAGALGAGALLGVGTAIGTRALARTVSESVMDRRYSTRAKERADLKPGERWSPLVPPNDGDGYADVMVPVMGIMGGGAAAYTAAVRMGTGRTKSVLAFAGLAAALGGVAAGAILGELAGARASHNKHGIEIDHQVDEAFRNFDANEDGSISTSDSRGSFPEYMIRNAGLYAKTDPWLSIEHAAKRADTDGNQRVSKPELKALFKSFDKNGDDRINEPEMRKFTHYKTKLESYALTEIV